MITVAFRHVTPPLVLLLLPTFTVTQHTGHYCVGSDASTAAETVKFRVLTGRGLGFWCAPSACEEDLEFKTSRLADMLTVSETLTVPGGMGHGLRGTLPLRRLVRCWLPFRHSS